MSKRMSWGLGVLIVLVIAGISYMFAVQHAEIQRLKKDAAVAEKLLEDSNKHQNQEPDVGNKPPGPAQAGFEWEWHGDHWCEVPVAQSDAPHQTPESEKIVFTPARKLNFPDKTPEKFPTEAELQEMDPEELLHLSRLYTKASNELRKTDPDPDAGTRLYNATIPILHKIIDAKLDRAAAISAEQTREHRKEFPVPWSRPATEELPAMRIDTKPPKKASNEGGKQ